MKTVAKRLLPATSGRAAPQAHTKEITMINSACSNLNLSEPAPHHLQEEWEARDLLIRILMAQGRCIVIFKFGAVSVAPELEPKLRTLIGHRCAILRLDGKFHIRDLDAEAGNAAR